MLRARPRLARIDWWPTTRRSCRIPARSSRSPECSTIRPVEPGARAPRHLNPRGRPPQHRGSSWSPARSSRQPAWSRRQATAGFHREPAISVYRRHRRRHRCFLRTCSTKYRRLGKIRCVHFVYMVRCADGTLYTGYARDPKQREQVHNSGRGARYTASRLPVSLVYSERCRSLSQALKREHELKGWTRGQQGSADCRRDRAWPKSG